MSKKNHEQKTAPADGTIVTKPVRAVKPRKVAVIGAGTKKTIPQSKSDRVLSLLKLASGATLDELMRATKWQAHSVRGFMSGHLKKQGRPVQSGHDEGGTRRYRLEVAAS